MESKYNITLNLNREAGKRKRARLVLIAYLEEIRFFHFTFQGVEVIKIMWQREGCTLRVRMGLLPFETNSIDLLLYSRIIIKRVRI